MLASYVRKWVWLVLITSVPAALLAAWIAPVLVPLLFGKAFASAASSAAIMALAVPFILLNAVLLSRSIARGATFEYLGIFIGVGLLSLMLDFILGKAYGANGIAWAIVIREMIMCVAFAAFPRRGNTRSIAVPEFLEGLELVGDGRCLRRFSKAMYQTPESETCNR